MLLQVFIFGISQKGATGLIMAQFYNLPIVHSFIKIYSKRFAKGKKTVCLFTFAQCLNSFFVINFSFDSNALQTSWVNIESFVSIMLEVS